MSKLVTDLWEHVDSWVPRKSCACIILPLFGKILDDPVTCTCRGKKMDVGAFEAHMMIPPPLPASSLPCIFHESPKASARRVTLLVDFWQKGEEEECAKNDWKRAE